MTILLTGGGTGGHITPILAVAHEVKSRDPDIRIVYVGERNGKFSDITEDNPDIDVTYLIAAGKFRRYHGESWLSRLVDIKTILMNIRDLAYVAIGIIQSWWLLGRVQPDAVLLKGGFVGVPVGIAAWLRHVPFVTHDSDAVPGLANRLVGRWALKNAVALEPSQYAYPKSKVVHVGVLVESHFTPVNQSLQAEFKRRLGIPVSLQLLLITGGSSGAQRLNVALRRIVHKLLADYPNLYIIHQTGRGKQGLYDNYQHARLKVLEFMKPMYVYTGASDIVVSRTSGNTLAELGTQGKAVIGVPSPFLTGGHQLKNAGVLVKKHAIIRVDETGAGTDAVQLDVAIRQLLNDGKLRQELAVNLSTLTVRDATQKLVDILLECAHKP